MSLVHGCMSICRPSIDTPAYWQDLPYARIRSILLILPQ